VTGTIPLTGATDETTTIVAAALALLLLGAGAVTVARRH
jgi:LPXTG-motif cell wall-anchored protein